METLSTFNLSRENLFILLCCRQITSVDPITTINDLVEQDLDWKYIGGMIRLHGIAGLVNSSLAQSHQLHIVPDGELESLKLTSRQTAFKNIVYRREFASLAKACLNAHIRIVPLKGIAFLTSLYAQNTAVRALSDIDILVESKNIKSVEKILLSMGYEQKQSSAHDGGRAFHTIYRRRLSGFTILIEAHWDIDYADSPYAIDITECWQRSHEVINDSERYYELCCEDTLILNCFHILRHIPKGPDVLLHLKNFCDIAAMITQWSDDIDWESVVQRSREYKVLRPVGLVLTLVQALLEVKQIPLSVTRALRDEGFQDEFIVCAVKEYILTTSRFEKKMLPFWMVDLATASSLREKVKIFRELPQIFLALFRARYYERYGRSTPKALAHIIWYYIKKAAAVISLWIRAPRKTAQLQNKMTSVNRKTQTVIDWLRH